MALDEKVKDILDNCPHYYDIINSVFSDDDDLTKELIKEYSLEIFDISNNNYGTINRLKVIDLIMFEYVSKTKFYYYAKELLIKNNDVNNLEFEDLLQNLVELYKKYTFKKEMLVYEEEVEEPRWL